MKKVLDYNFEDYVSLTEDDFSVSIEVDAIKYAHDYLDFDPLVGQDAKIVISKSDRSINVVDAYGKKLNLVGASLDFTSELVFGELGSERFHTVTKVMLERSLFDLIYAQLSPDARNLAQGTIFYYDFYNLLAKSPDLQKFTKQYPGLSICLYFILIEDSQEIDENKLNLAIKTPVGDLVKRIAKAFLLEEDGDIYEHNLLVWAKKTDRLKTHNWNRDKLKRVLETLGTLLPIENCEQIYESRDWFAFTKCLEYGSIMTKAFLHNPYEAMWTIDLTQDAGVYFVTQKISNWLADPLNRAQELPEDISFKELWKLARHAILPLADSCGTVSVSPKLTLTIETTSPPAGLEQLDLNAVRYPINVFLNELAMMSAYDLKEGAKVSGIRWDWARLQGKQD